MSLNIDRRDVAEDAAVLVRLTNLDNLDINRQAVNSGDRLAHESSRFPIEFVDKYIAEIGILENPSGRFDVGFGIAFVNRNGWILSILGKGRLPWFRRQAGVDGQRGGIGSCSALA